MPEKQEKQWARTNTHIPNMGRGGGVMSVVFSCSFFTTASKWGDEPAPSCSPSVSQVNLEDFMKGSEPVYARNKVAVGFYLPQLLQQ